MITLVARGITNDPRGVALVIPKFPPSARGLLSVPGGKVEKLSDGSRDETLLEALIREMMEETGLKVKENPHPILYGIREHLAPKGHFVEVSYAVLCSGELKPDTEEIEKALWLPPKDILAMPDSAFAFNHGPLLKDYINGVQRNSSHPGYRVLTYQ